MTCGGFCRYLLISGNERKESDAPGKKPTSEEGGREEEGEEGQRRRLGCLPSFALQILREVHEEICIIFPPSSLGC
ncbi:hypothetical protein RUM44_007854 [Polyplax serrata]|uniref:Uncharacterized protein n=1 Tax=Polyplax serrata TaxID=468196 RepID=A0ABR1B7D6_POLSC